MVFQFSWFDSEELGARPKPVRRVWLELAFLGEVDEGANADAK